MKRRLFVGLLLATPVGLWVGSKIVRKGESKTFTLKPVKVNQEHPNFPLQGKYTIHDDDVIRFEEST